MRRVVAALLFALMVLGFKLFEFGQVAQLNAERHSDAAATLRQQETLVRGFV